MRWYEWTGIVITVVAIVAFWWSAERWEDDAHEEELD